MSTTTTNTTTSGLLSKIREMINKTLLTITPIGNNHYFDPEGGRQMMQYSILFPGLVQNLKLDPPTVQTLIKEQTKSDVKKDRAVGILVGNCIGDAVGAFLEFIPVDSSLPPYQLKRKRNDAGRLAFLDVTQLDPESNDKQRGLFYPECSNKFGLNQGQWTDDFSMALCLADNMLVNGGYEGGDCRARYYNWWYFGYNNAFRFDGNKNRSSVGLGGNISKSIDDCFRFVGKSGKDIPGVYEAKGEDAGNGSIMRLGAVPIRYANNLAEAEKVAKLSSYATHPGPDAAACCQFMSYFCIKAVHRPANDTTTTLQSFVDSTIQSFLADHAEEMKSGDTGLQKLSALLQCQPPQKTEACWNWKSRQLPLEETISNRGNKYNGYPVNSGYFGSYCMDGLAMALWGIYSSQSFSDSIMRISNLLGDADTTAAIGGQMAGAWYGYNSLFDEDTPKVKEGLIPPFGTVMVENMRRWDPMCEIELRALLLFEDSQTGGGGGGASAPPQEAEPKAE